MNTMRFKRLLATFLCAFMLLAAGCALAQSVEMTAEMGYDGVATYLRRLPVTVEITNNGADATGALVMDVSRSESYYDRYTMPLNVAAGATVRVALPVTLTMRQESYRVQWLVNGKEAGSCEVKPANLLDPTYLTVGVLSNEPQKLSYLNITQHSDALKRGEYWQTVALDRDTFPTDASGMRFFDLLVVDGADASALSAEQQTALETWLRTGGVVLLGGGAQAATGFPYFERYTGVTAGDVASSDSLSAELLRLFRLSEAPLNETVTTVALEGANGRAVGESHLLDVTRVDSGYVFTAAFSLSEKPLSTWLGKNVIWQRMLLQYAQSRYQSIVEARTYGSYSNRYADSDTLNTIRVSNEGGMALPMVILVLFVVMVGFGSYFLLRKRDKNSWMWATAPALAILCSLLIWGVSGVLGLQRPIAVSYTIVNIGKDGSMKSYTGASVAKAANGPTKVSLKKGSVNLDQETSGFYDGGSLDDSAVKKLRYEYELGASGAVTFAAGSGAWSTSTFLADDVPIADVAVSGEASWDGGTLVFSIRNSGTVALSDGVVLSNYGFVSVPALLPGQTVTAKMVPNQTNILDPSGLKDGMLLNETERRFCSFYDFINAYRKGDTQTGKRELTLRSDMLNAYGNQANWYSNTGVGEPKYFAFSDSLAQFDVSVNDETVERKGQKDMLCVEMSLSPVAADGTVRFLSGAIPVSTAEADDQGVPHAVETSDRQSRYSSYRLSDQPIFAFDMQAAPKDWTVEHFDIAPRYAYYSYEVSLYRFRDGEWVTFKTCEYDQNTGKDKSAIAVPALSDFVDENGALYARFAPYGKNAEYTDIDTPALTMDGRLN